MAKIKGAIVVDTERCKGCNLCAVACPLHVIALAKEVNLKGYNYAQQILEDTCNGTTMPSRYWKIRATAAHRVPRCVRTVAYRCTK